MRGDGAAAGLNRPAITATVICACAMQGLDQTIVNVSVPHIQGSMSAWQDEISWVLTSYIVSSAIALVILAGLPALLLIRRPRRHPVLTAAND